MYAHIRERQGLKGDVTGAVLPIVAKKYTLIALDCYLLFFFATGGVFFFFFFFFLERDIDLSYVYQSFTTLG